MPNTGANDYLSGLTYDDDTSVFSLPLAAVKGVTADEIDQYSGDIRKILLGQLKSILMRFNSLELAQRPTGFTIVRGTPTGVNATTIRQSYTITFDLNADDVDLIADA